MDLYWSIYDFDSKLQTDLYENLYDDRLFLVTVRNNLLTLNFVDSFKGRISCKSQTKNELQISITALTIGMHLIRHTHYRYGN